ncbi:unnamed protein product [Sphagnum troendelagicum]
MLYLCRIASLNVLTCGMSQANVQQYYQQFEEQQIQSLIDQEVKELLCQMVAAFAQQQIGGPFHQNLATLQSGQYKPLPSPSMPPSMHLIVLQPPSAPTSVVEHHLHAGLQSHRLQLAMAQHHSTIPMAMAQHSHNSSNSAPQQQYANSKSTFPPQQPYLISSSTLQPQHTTSNTTSQHHYSNGLSRPPMSSRFRATCVSAEMKSLV